MKLVRVPVSFNPNYYINPALIERAGIVCEIKDIPDRHSGVGYRRVKEFAEDKCYIVFSNDKDDSDPLVVNCPIDKLIKLIEEA